MNWSTILKGTTTTKKNSNVDSLIDWNTVGHTLIKRGSQIAFITVVFFLIWRIGKRLLTRYLLKNPKFQEHMTGRKRTIAQLVVAAFEFLILLFYLYSLLTLLGIPVGTLLASVGLVSLALGMGAQGLVSDLITGINILSEGEYNIGDTVKIGTYTGTVLSFTLRNTRLKTTNGAVIYIPNRNITIVENLTHGSHSGWSMNINLNLSVENDLTDVNHAINTVNAALKDKFKNQIKKGPQIIGIVNQTGSSIIYQIHFQVVANSQSQVKNAYLSAYIKEFNQQNIKFSSLPTKQENTTTS
ncbi:mechanosensitive ion channel family protein [Lactobacillus johnsonii]|uniref:Mechanosensitive ion channel protein MscS n=1 Tax=Lactobacillus johnsonii TaxID=33959 RepID=A0A9X6RWZ3_LACJH|nr:mechanosensitive ion channel family protein [Lactobacillus johnsonii]OYS05393.1 mechanosensitive ion channel protein MscS [Lactobacillus johnsonii]OYS08132.1 mechanosensitive ion channel protein MscS [Lactobacillus johnsonii]OYS09990.1 mechanosensitive ion channel protein MscS [Lactobacillus johnsonii]OYS10010.1 mechanosensitive ion channel protein MscS [Lactobacillus johnsonii]OYS13671.1 mechanosensitive ion channel protein MscS [Lactobacillus johnsonii]